jgi:hypothetical protein
MMRAVFAKVLREEEAAVREIDRSRGVVRRKEDMCLLQVLEIGKLSEVKEAQAVRACCDVGN